MTINLLVYAVATCVKCGTTVHDGCNCWVKLQCPKCGKQRMVERDNSDPPATAMVKALCPECVGDDFSEVTYYDRDGEQIIEF